MLAGRDGDKVCWPFGNTSGAGPNGTLANHDRRGAILPQDLFDRIATFLRNH